MFKNVTEKMSVKYCGESANSEASIELQLEKLWKPIFDKYDIYKTGGIKIDEFKRILQESNNRLKEDIPEDVLDELINNADSFKDGIITYDEFLDLVHTSELGLQRPGIHRLIRYAAQAVVPKSRRQSVIRQYHEQYSCLPPPIFIITMSIIQIVCFIYYCIVLDEFSFTGPVPLKSPLIYDPCKRTEIWRFVTYMFIHSGLFHIFFNVGTQIVLGLPLEMVHKWWRVAIIYIAGVIGGCFAATLTAPTYYLAGASAGVYSLIAAHFASVAINWSEMKHNCLRLVILISYVAQEIALAIYARYRSDEQAQISHSAHFAGALVGFLIGVNVLRNLRMRRWEIILGRILLTIFILLMTFAIIFNLVNESHFVDPDEPERCSIATDDL